MFDLVLRGAILFGSLYLQYRLDKWAREEKDDPLVIGVVVEDEVEEFHRKCNGSVRLLCSEPETLHSVIISHDPTERYKWISLAPEFHPDAGRIGQQRWGMP